MNFFNQLLDPTRRFQRQYAEYLVERFRFLPWPGDVRVDLDREFVPVRELERTLGAQARVLLTGDAGIGKTTTLAYLALSRARALLHDASALVPIFFSARQLHQALPRLADWPRGLNLDDSLTAQCPRDFFADAVAKGRALVLIDDIDALPGDSIKAWLDGFAGARLVATSQAARVADPATPSGADFFEFPFRGFRDDEIEELARLRHREKAEAFITALKASGVPRSLTANPFTLTLLSLVWNTDRPLLKPSAELYDVYEIKQLPARRAELFEAYARSVLGDSDETEKMLEGVALAIQRGRPAPDEFLPRARGFLRAGKNQTAEFVHDLWRAYFAARALRRSPDLAALSEHLHEPNWRDTVLFYAGLGDSNELADALLARGDPSTGYTPRSSRGRWQALALAGFAIAHSQQVRAELRESVTAQLTERAWNGDEDAVAALSEMHSETAVDQLAARLKEKDPTVRTRAAEILGKLQLDRAIEYLLPQLRDVNGDVRDKVVEALGRARTNRVIEPLLVALRGDPRVGSIDTRLRVAAAKALGDVGSDKAVPALIVDLQVGEPEVRAVAAESLKRIKSPLMIKPLESVMQTGDEDARKYAANVLASMNGNIW